MRVFLTGGTGYIGKALCRRLVEAGHEVRALVRPTSDAAPLAALGIATFRGDVTDRASMREGMSGADWVVHAAAELDVRAPEERMRRVNVEGSENTASLAHKLGVGRFLSVSSIAYFGGSPADGAAADESARPLTPFPSPYSATKHAAERAVQEWGKRGLRVNTVYPSLVYGPPGKREGANAILRQIIRRRLPAVVGGDRRTSWVFLDDLVDGIARVMERAAPGRDYVLAGEIVRLRDLVRRVCALAGVAPPRRELPVGLVRAGVAVTAPLFRLAGRRPPFQPSQISSLARHWAFDDARARRELDWRPRGLDEGLPPTVAFLAAN
ncbi:MAG TPA: NAD-dependent epimerase/dehydratase family protein [Thermoanaerobaculia bacterium]|nr:NAD-dependent epimerase/dehydratase family protein [Thermoanaerobaculia bacterium]